MNYLVEYLDGKVEEKQFDDSIETIEEVSKKLFKSTTIDIYIEKILDDFYETYSSFIKPADNKDKLMEIWVKKGTTNKYEFITDRDIKEIKKHIKLDREKWYG